MMDADVPVATDISYATLVVETTILPILTSAGYRALDIYALDQDKTGRRSQGRHGRGHVVSSDFSV